MHRLPIYEGRGYVLMHPHPYSEYFMPHNHNMNSPFHSDVKLPLVIWRHLPITLLRHEASAYLSLLRFCWFTLLSGICGNLFFRPRSLKHSLYLQGGELICCTLTQISPRRGSVCSDAPHPSVPRSRLFAYALQHQFTQGEATY